MESCYVLIGVSTWLIARSAEHFDRNFPRRCGSPSSAALPSLLNLTVRFLTFLVSIGAGVLLYISDAFDDEGTMNLRARAGVILAALSILVSRGIAAIEQATQKEAPRRGGRVMDTGGNPMMRSVGPR